MKKTFKVVMLPTKKSTLILNKFENRLSDFTIPEGNSLKPQHLYIISDDEIKEGDWFIMNGVIVRQCKYIKEYMIGCNYQGEHHNSVCKKIVATTNKSLGNQRENHFDIIPLPQLPESFIQAYIKAYNESKPITEVDLLCKEVGNKLYDGIPQTRPDNTVIVHQSKMYSKSDMIRAFECGRNYQLTGENNLDEIL